MWGLLLLRSTSSGPTDSAVAAHGLQSAESVAAAQGRSCSEARGMPPGQGLSQGALHWQVDS